MRPYLIILSPPILNQHLGRLKLKSTRGEREVPVEEFETGYMDNILEPDEILTEIIVPYMLPGSGASFVEEVIRSGDLGRKKASWGEVQKKAFVPSLSVTIAHFVTPMHFVAFCSISTC